MKILQVITSLRSGGAERLVADLSKGLKENGETVEIFLLDGTSTPIKKELEQSGIKIHEAGKGYNSMWNLLSFFKLKNLLKNGKFDIVHSHNTTAQIITAMALVSGIGAVTTEHNTSNRRRNFPMFKGFDRWLYSKYDKVACVSEQVKKRLISYLNVNEGMEKYQVIYNGINLEKFRIEKTHDAPLDKKKRVIMVAGFRPQKDQATLIRAFTYLPEDYSLQLVGDGTEKDNCIELAKKLGLDQRIEFTGFRNDISKLLEKASVLVHSTHYEGFGLCVVEAMAAGIPVIASDVEGLSETTGEAALLFRVGDSRQLASLLQRLCEDPALYQNLIEKGLNRAKRFDIKETIGHYKKLYQE